MHGQPHIRFKSSSIIIIIIIIGKISELKPKRGKAHTDIRGSVAVPADRNITQKEAGKKINTRKSLCT